MTQAKRSQSSDHRDRFLRLGRACDSIGRHQDPSQDEMTQCIQLQLTAALKSSPENRPGLALLVCNNQPCERAGAQDLIDTLRARAQAQSIALEISRSECLDGCEFGPCLALGTKLYGGALDAMIDPESS